MNKLTTPPAAVNKAPLPRQYAYLAAKRDGQYVFPLEPGGKRPIVSDWEHRATCDPDEVVDLFRDHPRANYGIACGPSGLVVIDIDIAKGDQPSGRDSWSALFPAYDPPLCAQVLTPSGGVHYYYFAPSHTEIRNSAGYLGPGVDVRAVGGYVVGYGSRIGEYQYRTSSGAPPLPEDMPPRLLDLLKPPSPPLPPQAQPTVADSNGYVAAALRNEWQKVANAPEGSRNQILYVAAHALGQLVGAGLLDYRAVFTELCHAAEFCRYRGEAMSMREITNTITSGLARGVANPRRVEKSAR